MKFNMSNFLKSFDVFLLSHFPILWATRAYYFFFYSLICGNLLMSVLGYLYPISLVKIPSYNYIVLITDLLRLSGLLVIIYWVFLQIRDAKAIVGLRQIVSTLVIYMLCLASIVANTLVFGSVVRSQVAQLVNVDQVSKDYVHYQTQKKLIINLVLWKLGRSDIDIVGLRKSELNESGKGRMNRYLDLMDELARIGFPLRAIPDSTLIEHLKEVISNSVKFSELMKIGFASELQDVLDGRTNVLLPISIVLADDKVLQFLKNYGVQNYSIIELENKMVELISFANSRHCVVRGVSDSYLLYFDSEYTSIKGSPTFEIPEREQTVLISTALSIFSISILTLVLRSYKRKIVWIALFLSIGLFFVILFVWLYADQKYSLIMDTNHKVAAIHTTFVVTGLPFLMRVYFSKRNGRLKNIILLIPLAYVFLFSFFLGSVMILNPLSFQEFFGSNGYLGFFGISSLIFSIAYFNALLKINHLPV